MNDWIQLEQVSQYFTTGSLGYKLLMGIFVLIAYRILKRIVNRAILNLATTKGVKKARLSFIQRCFNVALLFLTASIFAIITGIGYGDVSLFLSSIFAVLGVAFIAQWSILSNITASFLIFFVFPYRVGDRIKVVDKDEDICGEIQEISMFHVLIKHDNGNLITYPNNQILSRRHDRGVHQGLLRAGVLVAAASELLPVHRTVGRVRHPAAGWVVARARRLRHGAPERAEGRRYRPRRVEWLRVRVRHRPHGDDAPPGRGPARHVFQRHPLHLTVLRVVSHDGSNRLE